MGVKRSYVDMVDQQEHLAAQSPIISMFENFRAEIDEHHERRERIIKASRDVTAASKKIIFTLQRLRKLNEPLPDHVTKSNTPYYTEISTRLSSISQDLQNLNAHRYARQVSGGLQEYIEAASFEHYLTTASLLTYEEAVAKVRSLDPNGPGVELGVEDYLLGIYDMTGEVMKFAITAMGSTRAVPVSEPVFQQSGDAMETDAPATAQRTVLSDLRDLRSALEALNTRSGVFHRECEKKHGVMQNSVEKVEKQLYELIVRGAERPRDWMPDLSESAGRPVEVEG